MNREICLLGFLDKGKREKIGYYLFFAGVMLELLVLVTDNAAYYTIPYRGRILQVAFLLFFFEIVLTSFNLKEWILNNTADVRIKPVSFKGKDYVALVCPKGCSNKSVNNIFREIFSEIAPKNDFAAFKGELFRRGLLCSDTNYDCVDIQKTISSFKARELGTEKCKITNEK